MGYIANNELKKQAKEIQKSGKSIQLTPKELLSYFGVGSRKTHVKWWVDRGLKELKLKTVPDYKTVWLHGNIELTTDDILAKKNNEIQNEQDDEIIQKLKLIKAANTTPLSINRDASLEKAMTIMMMNDYSQLPVMNKPSSREVDGVISWHSIGWAASKGKANKTVADCMTKEFTILRYETALMDAVEIVKQKEVVLVQKKDKTICGLVTITDIAAEFFSFSEPYFYLGQIENSIREIIGDTFSQEELENVKFGDDQREIQSISDLTFNEYIQLMRKGDNWAQLKIPIDKDEFTKRLEHVRVIRNEVMHFNTDIIEDEQRLCLRQTANFLKEILNK